MGQMRGPQGPSLFPGLHSHAELRGRVGGIWDPSRGEGEAGVPCSTVLKPDIRKSYGPSLCLH